MKSLFSTIFLFYSISFFAQNLSALENVEWLNNDLDYLKFSNDTLTYSIHNTKHKLAYRKDKDNTITLLESYTVGGTIKKEEKLHLKLKQYNKNKLVIYPVEDKLTLDQESYKKLNYEPFFKKKQFVFSNKQDKLSKLDYEKITFHGSTCFGTCPSFTVEINREGQVFYQGRIYTKDFTGDFEGLLPREERVNLIKILNRSQIALVDKNWKQTSKVSDQPRYNYIVELRNGKIIEINTNDQHPVLDQLSNYLVQIPKKLELSKAEKPHVYKKPSLKDYEIVSLGEE